MKSVNFVMVNGATVTFGQMARFDWLRNIFGGLLFSRLLAREQWLEKTAKVF